MKVLLILLTIVLINNLLASDLPTSEVIKDREHYLKNEILINDLNEDIGVNVDRVYTGNDKHHFSIGYQFSPDYGDFTKVQAFEGQYHYKVDNMHDTWLGLLVKKDQNKFKALSNNSSTASRTPTTNSDYDLARADETKMDILTIGAGVGYRFKLLLDFADTDSSFEKLMVFFNYMRMTDNEYNIDYNGFGLTADYSLLVRSGKYLFYGPKLSYQFGAMKKVEKSSGESVNDRSRSIGWLSTGFTAGYNF